MSAILPSNIIPFGTSETVGNELLRGMIDRSLTSITLTGVDAIGDYAFAYMRNMTTAHFPDATEIKQYAFYSAGIETIDAPLVQSIGASAFVNTRLRVADFPMLTRIYSSGLSTASTLESVNAPMLERIDSNAFDQSRMTSANFPRLKTLGGASCFRACQQLRTVYLGQNTSVVGNLFQRCTALEVVEMPMLTSAADSTAWKTATALHTLILPNVQRFTSNCFSDNPITTFRIENRTIAQIKASTAYSTCGLTSNCRIYAQDGAFNYGE